MAAAVKPYARIALSRRSTWTRGWADQLESLSPVPLPWRTAWSRWHPYGVLGRRPGLPGPVQGVEAGT
ncbi:hypothetical protein J7I94_21425 [Streptomyces sp. ISL-12]|uniref:hypothetical protein n=1 Tax=Streptomyces sp. ISL-12 TaxID=2819177 RepID=UPI001BE968E0|nr:hypothetical protein [Streptomyces sp. ISL-12]MBT2413089.1 hypothetical protein [Streptomyces sp. ISL-12]